MALPGTILDREYKKFKDGESGVAVNIAADGDSLPVETAGIRWDTIITTFPDSITELFTYSLNSVVVQTVTVVYESASKKVPISVVRVRL